MIRYAAELHVLSRDSPVELIMEAETIIPLRMLPEDDPVGMDVEQIREVHRDVPDYTGEYDVVSALYDTQTLGTQGRRMKRDLTVEPIPIYEASNPAGGKTVTIGD